MYCSEEDVELSGELVLQRHLLYQERRGEGRGDPRRRRPLHRPIQGSVPEGYDQQRAYAEVSYTRLTWWQRLVLHFTDPTLTSTSSSVEWPLFLDIHITLAT